MTGKLAPLEIAAFDDLKQAVLDCCALHYPDTTKFLVLETDASTTVCLSVLSHNAVIMIL
jgi:hypothetical protein